MSFPQPSKPVIIIVVLTVLLSVSFLAARRPYYNWDMFPYMAIAMHAPSVPFDTTHRDVYRVASATLPPADFQAISIRQSAWMKDASAFEGILKYYTIKPGYNLFVLVLHKIGVNPVTSTWLPSVVSYFLLGGLLLFWTLHMGPAFPAGLYTLVIMLSPLLLDLARYSSPDMLCATISVVGFMLILSHKKSPGLGCLLAAVWIRPDAAILLTLICIALYLSGELSLRSSLLFCIAAVASVVFLFKSASLFSEYLFLDAPVGERFMAYRNGIATLLNSYTLPVMLLTAALIYWRRQYKLRNLGTWLVTAAVASMVVRYALHPFVEDRFHLPAYLLILLVAWGTLVTRFYPRTHATEM